MNVGATALTRQMEARNGEPASTGVGSGGRPRRRGRTPRE
jgi:hypothetical protein